MLFRSQIVQEHPEIQFGEKGLQLVDPGGAHRQIFLPIATSFGMTEIQFGVMLIFNMCLGNITPPVGSVLFVGCGIGHVSIEQVTSKLIPYFVALVLALLAVTYIPALSLGLPSLMGLI